MHITLKTNKIKMFFVANTTICPNNDKIDGSQTKQTQAHEYQKEESNACPSSCELWQCPLTSTRDAFSLYSFIQNKPLKAVSSYVLPVAVKARTWNINFIFKIQLRKGVREKSAFQSDDWAINGHTLENSKKNYTQGPRRGWSSCPTTTIDQGTHSWNIPILKILNSSKQQRLIFISIVEESNTIW